MSRTSRFMCFLCIVLLIINLISEINGLKEERKGIRGGPGAKGEKGEKGERGERGDVGPYGKIKVDSGDDDTKSSSAERSNEPSETAERGSEANPATSCQDDTLDVFESDKKIVYIYNDEKRFQVTCVPSADPDADNVYDKTCLLQNEPKKFNDTGYKYPEAGKPFWLSTVGFDLLGFYNDFQIKYISQLKYILKISYKVSIEIVVHCKNTVISKDPEKYLQIHLWDGQNVGPSTTLNSPAYYEIPDELNKCKDFPDETKWGYATIRLTTSSNFIKDFYIQDIQKEKDQEIYVELKELCFYN